MPTRLGVKVAPNQPSWLRLWSFCKVCAHLITMPLSRVLDSPLEQLLLGCGRSPSSSSCSAHSKLQAVASLSAAPTPPSPGPTATTNKGVPCPRSRVSVAAAAHVERHMLRAAPGHDHQAGRHGALERPQAASAARLKAGCLTNKIAIRAGETTRCPNRQVYRGCSKMGECLMMVPQCLALMEVTPLQARVAPAGAFRAHPVVKYGRCDALRFQSCRSFQLDRQGNSRHVPVCPPAGELAGSLLALGRDRRAAAVWRAVLAPESARGNAPPPAPSPTHPALLSPGLGPGALNALSQLPLELGVQRCTPSRNWSQRWEKKENQAR